MASIIRVAQGVGTGFFCSLMIGLILGMVGLGGHMITFWASFILSFLPAGMIAGRQVPNPYVVVALAGATLFVLNQGVSLLLFATLFPYDFFLLFFQLLVGVTLSEIGALIINKPWKRRQQNYSEV